MSILQSAAKRKEEMAKSGLLVGPDPIAMASVTTAGPPEPIIKPAIAGCTQQGLRSSSLGELSSAADQSTPTLQSADLLPSKRG